MNTNVTTVASGTANVNAEAKRKGADKHKSKAPTTTPNPPVTTPTTPTNPSMPVTPPGQYNFAPYVQPVTAAGRNLCCVAIKWKNNPGSSVSSVGHSCSKTAENFNRLSNGLFKFNASAHSVQVPYDYSYKNVAAANGFCKKAMASKGFNDNSTTFALVNHNAAGGSHSGGNTSEIMDTITSTFYHEIGRTNPINLGSSGAFKNGKYVDQGDGTTFMGHFASDQLTASQLYYLGWLPNNKVALHDVTKTADYVLDPLNNTSANNNLKAVAVLNPNAKPLFLSRPALTDGKHTGKPLTVYALHLASNPNLRGSERLTVFSKSATYNGLNFEEISNNGTSSTIRITPSAVPASAQK